MKKMIGTVLLLMASSAFKGLRANTGGHLELTKMRMSLLYLRSIKTFRLLFMSMLSMGVCLIFLFTGLILLHLSLFLYAPWSVETKMMVGLISSLVYLLITAALISQIFASDKWLKIFHADALMDHLHKETAPKDDVQPVE